MRSKTWAAVIRIVRGLPSGVGASIRKPVPTVRVPSPSGCSSWTVALIRSTERSQAIEPLVFTLYLSGGLNRPRDDASAFDHSPAPAQADGLPHSLGDLIHEPAPIDGRDRSRRIFHQH